MPDTIDKARHMIEEHLNDPLRRAAWPAPSMGRANPEP